MATRQKQKAVRRNAVNEGMWKASLKHLPMSARKVRVVADCIRGVSIMQAMDRLAAVRKAAARPLRNVISSAVANASSQGVDDVDLYLHRVAIHKGPMRKRMRARAQGRGMRVRKQTSHIDVIVSTVLMK